VDALILHHYPISPFAEKARTMLGYKRLAWRSVEIPIVMPKPDLTALTGGYRKTPVLQIGADVYCDSLAIARVLDERHPEPAIFSAANAALDVAAGRWLDQQLFLSMIALFFVPAAAAASTTSLGGGEAAMRFAEDRGSMMRAARVRPPRPAEARVVVDDTLARLDRQLAAGGPFLAGSAPGWSDFCAFHPVWAAENNAGLAPLLAPHSALCAWAARMRAFGHGSPSPLEAAEALAIARSSTPRALASSSGPPLDGIALGDAVTVAAADYALEPSAGTLVHLGADEVAIRRVDQRAGEVVVHFPRIGFSVRRADG